MLLWPGSWKGQGKISLPLLATELSFTTQWEVGEGTATQTNTFEELGHVVVNQWSWEKTDERAFNVTLASEFIHSSGEGVREEDSLSWSLPEGWERYTRSGEGYTFEAQYGGEGEISGFIERV